MPRNLQSKQKLNGPVIIAIVVALIGLVGTLGGAILNSYTTLEYKKEELAIANTQLAIQVNSANAAPTIENTATIPLTISPSLTPTSTARQQATTELETVSSTWTQLVFDSFDSNNNNWLTGEQFTDDKKDLAKIFINGKYYIDVKTGDGGGWWLLSEIGIPEVFYLKVDMQRTQQEGCDMGLVWGNEHGYYMYEIDDVNQEYKLVIYDRTAEQKFRNIIGYTYNQNILSGEINRLAVLHNGKTITLFINDQYITSVESEYMNDGKLGFYIAVCNDNRQVTFEFDNLELRTP